MNKSKFLKKSLAAVLAVLMVVAMIPLSAAAVAPTFSAANVTTDVSSRTVLTIDETAKTITGNISLAAKEFTLELMPRDNITNDVSVTYEDISKSDKPMKSATLDRNNYWVISRVDFSRYDFQNEDTVSMKVIAQNDSTGEQTEYTVILNRVQDPSDATITDLRVWTKSTQVNTNDGVLVPENDETGRVPQLGNTVIDQTNRIIDITVPFNAEAVWVRDFVMPSGAKASITRVDGIGGTVDMDENAILVRGNDTANTTSVWSTLAPTDKSDVVEIAVKVTAGTHSNDYTLRLTRASGIESFTFEDAIDSRVFPAESKIVVVMPFGYTNTKYTDKDSSKTLTTGDVLKVTPKFELQYSETEVPTLKWDDTELTSGETKIELADVFNSVKPVYDYTDEANRLDAVKTFKDWNTAHSGSVVQSKQLTVSYVEGTSRKYDVVVVEAEKNYEAQITGLDIENDSATVDEENKTITIELPTGTDLTKVKLGDIKISASDAATITIPMYDPNNVIEFVEYGRTPAHNHASVSAIDARSVTSTFEDKYVSNTNRIIHLTAPVVIRVTSEDGSTTADYTLTTTVNANYVKPAITSLSIKKGDDVYEGEIDENTGIIRVKVPYGVVTTGDLEGAQLFYAKTTGSTINIGKSGNKLDGKEAILHSANNDVAPGETITSNSSNTATKGSDITVKIRNPFTNQIEEEVYNILLVRQDPGHNSKLKSLNLTSNGKTGEMKKEEVNDENTYTGTITGTDIKVSLPWSHYIQDGTSGLNNGNVEGTTLAGYTESNILDALRMITETNDEGATVWYTINCWDYLVPAPDFNDDDVAKAVLNEVDRLALGTNAPDWEIVVLSEQVSVDYKQFINAATGYLNNWRDCADPTSTTVISAIAPKTDYTVYKLSISQADAMVNHQLTSVKLVGPTVKGFNVGSQDLRIDGNTIRGTIPYSMVSKTGETPVPIYLDYSASPRAFVLAGGTAVSSVGQMVWTTPVDNTVNGGVSTNLLIGDNTNNVGYPNAKYGHFCDIELYEYDSDNTPPQQCSLLPNGGAVMYIDEQGKVHMGTLSSAVDKLYVTNEDASKGVDMYGFELTVKDPSRENKILTFNVEGQVGSSIIDNDNDLITVTVPSVAELTALKTSWTLSDGATIEQPNYVNGDPMNYSTERLFTVVAENRTSKRTYRVNVNVQRGYTDVQEGVWYFDPIMYVTDKGWMCGSGDGTFKPMDTMTRAEFATMIAKADATFDPADYTDTAFPDVEGWAVPYIAFCADKEYILGSTDGNFNPDAPITREQAAIIMCKVKGVTPVANSSTTFVDNGKISSWAIDYVKAACDAKYFQGVGDNAFAPQRQIMRCEAAQILMNCDK